jgi:hypothetical protein
LGNVGGPEIANQAGSLIAGLSPGTIAGLTTIGLSAAVSAGLTQMDYIHKRDNLKDLYKEELASKLRKTVDKVTTDDLDTLAKENNTIAAQLQKTRKQRNFGVGLSFMASMAALSVMAFLVTPLLPVLGLATVSAATGAIVMPAVGTGAWFGAMGVGALSTLLTYNAVKAPLHAIADKIFGLEYKTTHDHITAVKLDREAGKVISREQVLSVFAAANRQVDGFIAAEYGNRFDKLSLEEKQRATQNLSKLIPLDKLTNDINSGKVNVTELAFAVEGQISGVGNGRDALAPKQSGLFSSMWAGIKNTVGIKSSPANVGAGASVQASASSAVLVDAGNERPARGFVERLGRSKREQTLSHVDQLERARAEQATVQQQHT